MRRSQLLFGFVVVVLGGVAIGVTMDGRRRAAQAQDEALAWEPIGDARDRGGRRGADGDGFGDGDGDGSGDGDGDGIGDGIGEGDGDGIGNGIGDGDGNGIGDGSGDGDGGGIGDGSGIGDGDRNGWRARGAQRSSTPDQRRIADAASAGRWDRAARMARAQGANADARYLEARAAAPLDPTGGADPGRRGSRPDQQTQPLRGDGDVLARVALAANLLHADDPAAALLEVDRALKQQPWQVDALRVRAAALRGLGRQIEADDAQDRLRWADPTVAEGPRRIRWAGDAQDRLKKSYDPTKPDRSWGSAEGEGGWGGPDYIPGYEMDDGPTPTDAAAPPPQPE